MSRDYRELVEQRRRLRAEIEERRRETISHIKQLMSESDITLQDLADHRIYRSQLPPRYADAAGNTWTGVGRRPQWIKALVNAGVDIELYRVKS